MPQTVIIQHGLGGPVPWFKWFQKKCMEAGASVKVPLMSTAKEPVCDSWMEEMIASYADISDTVIVAHSLGGLALVHYLGSHAVEQIAKVVVFIAAPARYTGKEKTQEFYATEPNWDEAKKHAKRFVYIHSSDDTWVPSDHGIVYKERLGAELISMTGEGHFLGETNEVVWKLVSSYITQ